VPVNTQAIGKTYESTLYAVGREKIKEYARAVGETNPIHLDVQAARDAGHADVVAPPMFVVVYSAPSVGPPIFDPEIELNFAMMVHGGQQFEWGPLVVAGDEITTTASVKDISERDGRGYYVFESVSTNQRGEQVARGMWTNIVRGV
jgi:acyl dehydratase